MFTEIDCIYSKKVYVLDKSFFYFKSCVYSKTYQSYHSTSQYKYLYNHSLLGISPTEKQRL